MDIKCGEGQTLEIDYVNRRWICKTGNYCPPKMGGVVFGCPALPPPVPENSTGKFSNFSWFSVDAFIILLQRPIALIPPMTLVSVVAATSNSSSMKIVTRPSTAPQVQWKKERMVAQSNAMKEK